MKNAKCSRNQKTRRYLEEMVKDAKPGSIMFTEEISIALSTKMRSVSNRTVGRLMSSMDGIRKERDCVWVKE